MGFLPVILMGVYRCTSIHYSNTLPDRTSTPIDAQPQQRTDGHILASRMKSYCRKFTTVWIVGQNHFSFFNPPGIEPRTSTCVIVSNDDWTTSHSWCWSIVITLTVRQENSYGDRKENKIMIGRQTKYFERILALRALVVIWLCTVMS
jgi:hypothetical protein